MALQESTVADDPPGTTHFAASDGRTVTQQVGLNVVLQHVVKPELPGRIIAHLNVNDPIKLVVDGKIR